MGLARRSCVYLATTPSDATFAYATARGPPPSEGPATYGRDTLRRQHPHPVVVRVPDEEPPVRRDEDAVRTG